MAVKLNGSQDLGLYGNQQTSYLVKMMKNKEEYLSTSVLHTKMTNRSKTEVLDCQQYLTGGEKLSVEHSFHFCTMMRTFLCPSIQLHNNIYWRCHPSHCFLTKQYQATLLLTLTSCPKYRPKYQVNKTQDQDPAGKPLLHWYGCMGKKHFG